MSRFWRIIVNLTVWCALLVYLVVVSRYCSSHRDRIEIKGTEIRVMDSARQQIITPYMVKLWLSRDGIDLLNKQVDKLDISKIERAAESRGFVKNADVYTDLDGILHIDITQRVPIVRVNTVNGYNFYITDDLYILPLQNHAVQYVPIITGWLIPPFGREFVGSLTKLNDATKKKYGKNYVYLMKLINFVRFVGDDKFWSAEIQQINIIPGTKISDNPADQNPMIEIVPRTGNHIVLLGSLDDVDEKLDKLLRFYNGALKYEGWGSQRYIDLRFRGQVVCRTEIN